MPRLTHWLAGLLTFWLCAAVNASETPAGLRFGVVPQQAASQLARLWGPLLTYIGERAGVPLQFHTAPDIPQFEQRCAAGEYDIAYMNPYHYILFHRAPGYEAFARQKDARIRGLLVVRKDSPIQSVAELAGATLAFPAPAAFAASVLPRAQLHKDGIPFTTQYVSSHDSVYRAVVKGLYPAGGGISRTFEGMDADIREQLRVLWSTGTYTPHAIAAHPRLPQETLERIRRVMLDMDQDPTGRELLAALQFKGIEAGVDADWDDVRTLDINADLE